MTDRRRQGDELTGRRGGYAELKGELRHFFVRIWGVLIVIGLTSAVALAGFGYLLYERGKDDKQVCENQNTRHDNAIKALKIGSDLDQKNAPNEAARVEIRRRRDVTISLIDALTPKTDCDDPGGTIVKPIREPKP